MRRRAAIGRSIRYRATLALLVVGALWLLFSLVPSKPASFEPVSLATPKLVAKPANKVAPPTTMAAPTNTVPSRVDYSYQGPLTNLFVAQLSGGGFEGETQHQFERRLQQWRANIQSLESVAAMGAGHAHLAAWPVAFHTHGYAFRSAMPLTNTLFVSIALSKPFSSEGVAFHPKTCVLAKVVDRTAAAEKELACTIEYSNNKMLFILKEPAQIGSQPLAFFIETTAGKLLVIPVEPLPQANPLGKVHVCTQGVLYPEQKFGPMPDDHVESLLQHYAKFGADHLHFYTNSSYFANALLRGVAKLDASSTLQVWIHDTPLPTLAISLSDLTSVAGGFQHFAINDCTMRSWAMGAAYVMFGDMDEYSFPTTVATAKLGELLAKESVAMFGSGPGVLYQSSYIFHTLYCDDANAKSITKRYTVSQLDAGAYQGRRKGIFCVGNMNAEYLSRHVFFDVHDLGSLSHAMSNSVHLHHYREGWHPAVCSKRSSDLAASQSEWSTDHAKCGQSH
ncbi:hypothetical protein BASA81_001009 [Batrachochytrium salamandrivorans]|nr:hypothetical protein BASA81_001009 [Batrachochytrium salamandrivorans]